MSRILKILIASLVFVVCSFGTARAQNVAIKTNLAYLAAGSLNLGVEVALTKKITLDLEGIYNPFMFDTKANRKMLHWVFAPEFKFWQAEKFNRGYVGVNIQTGSFNVAGMNFPLGLFPAALKYRYEAWFAGFGVSYGWQWYLSPHWNFEASLGVGYFYINYNQFATPMSGDIIRKNVPKHYFGPTKLSLSFSYLFGSRR